MTLAALYNASYTVCSYELHDSPHPNLLTVREASLTTVIIPASVKTIGDHTFLTNQILTALILHGPTRIGHYAFEGNQLIDIVIPDSVTSLGSGAFLIMSCIILPYQVA